MGIAHDHLESADPKLGELIRNLGHLEFTKGTVNFDCFATSIIFQQLSVKAAQSIARKTKAGLGIEAEAAFTPELFLGHSIDSLRPYGLSRQKATYLLDLAERTTKNEIHFHKFESMSDEAIIAELTQVKGIGAWTVQMVLMFDMARPDVFAPHDLGLQAAIQKLDGLETRLKPKQMLERAEIWRPYRSYACLYLWKSLEKTPAL
ncbi:MAG: DNA-3-methyladenine glycosylase 2 family protein [Armatimonadetes bacterium]|nr:DNA-3-methyladenine glycosylase 2 family protein [Armatimonadota bacterium]